MKHILREAWGAGLGFDLRVLILIRGDLKNKKGRADHGLPFCLYESESGTTVHE
jgi:hypothetical protein